MVGGFLNNKQQFKILGLVIPPFSLPIVPLLIATGIICLGIFIAWQRQKFWKK